jgi:hypothetical protein
MGKRPSLICFILLLISGMAEIIIAAENDDSALSASSEMTNGNPIIEQEETVKEMPTKSVTKITGPDKRRSVKMIVGGDSDGGVAKRVILPVKD